MCLTRDVRLQMRPYKTSCCAEHVSFTDYFYFIQILRHLTLSMTLKIAHYTAVIMLEARSKDKKRDRPQ